MRSGARILNHRFEGSLNSNILGTSQLKLGSSNRLLRNYELIQDFHWQCCQSDVFCFLFHHLIPVAFFLNFLSLWFYMQMMQEHIQIICNLLADKDLFYACRSLLAGINIAVFLFEIASPIRNSDVEQLSLPLIYGAKINKLILLGEWWRLLTPMFLVPF